MFKKLAFVAAAAFFFGGAALASEDSFDEYYHQTECPQNGESYEKNGTSDEYGFVRCQCVSYVADKLSRLFTERYWEHRGQADIMTKFMNSQYYMPQTYVSGGTTKAVTSWSNANKWRSSALRAEIGVTGSRDNFVWDMASYNAAFPGDVAWWDAWVVKNPDGSINEEESNSAGHVAFVESAEPDAYGKGVKCVAISEYNWVKHDFNRRTVCKSDGGHAFPDAFLHIDRDHAYCISHPDVGSCPKLFGKQVIASADKGDGIGGGSDFFNLKVNNFYVVDASGNVLDPDICQLTPGETITVKVQVKAKDGDTHDHMRDGKDTIEVDLYKRHGAGDWIYLKREYIKATNLPGDSTHTESVTLMVPNTNQEPLSFKAKIDAEDEAMEANEGDNWSQVETFAVGSDTRSFDLTVTSIQLANTKVPVPAGGQMGARMAIRNIGPHAPDVGIQSDYLISGPGTNYSRIRIAGDASEAADLVPGRDQWEEIQSLVPAPTVPGTYTLFGCTDVGNAIVETDEGNNCLSTTFQVVPPRPDFVITAVGPAGGKMSFSKGSRIYPAMYIKNVGNANSPSRIQSSYFYSGPETGNVWRYITGDNTEASELCVGCQMREQYDSGMKINTRGTYFFKGCADVNGAVAESDEANNCTVSGAVTIY